VHVQQELAERGPQIGRQRRVRHALQNDLHPRCDQPGSVDGKETSDRRNAN
jgi:hypothetical protein